MAMPISAAASAGVNAVADLGDDETAALHFADDPPLVLRHKLDLWLNTQFLGDGLGSSPIVAGQHDGFMFGVAQ